MKPNQPLNKFKGDTMNNQTTEAKVTRVAELMQRESDYSLDLDFCTKTATNIVKMLERDV
jgi:hypothetical protein